MNEISAEAFVKRFILDPIDAGNTPKPVSEPILIHGLFPEIAGKETTLKIVMHDIIKDSDVMIIPTEQTNDDTQLYDFVLSQLEFLEIYYLNEIDTDYVRYVHALAEKLIHTYEDARGMLLPVLFRFTSVALLSINEDICGVFKMEQAIELLKKYKCIISYIKFVEDDYVYKDIEDEAPMWKTNLLYELVQELDNSMN